MKRKCSVSYDAMKSMSLASGMMVFGATCDSIKKEWPECEKVEDAYTKFDDSEENGVWQKIPLKLFVLYSKIIQSSFHCILTGEAGITQKAPLIFPVLDTPIII